MIFDIHLCEACTQKRRGFHKADKAAGNAAKQHGDEQLASQIQQYPVMQETMREFSDFNKAFAETNGNKQALEPRFGKTYWFYLKFRVRRVGKVQ